MLATPIRWLGATVQHRVAAIGAFGIFAARALAACLRPPRLGELVRMFYHVGVSSLLVVALTGAFIGMVLAVQGYDSFTSGGFESRLGWAVNLGLVKELGPILCATMIAGRVGGAMAAELGTMRVTEQIDALDALGVDPVRYLVAPRFLACVLLLPLLTVVADFAGMVAGGLVSTRMLGVDAHFYWEYSAAYIGKSDVLSGLFKALVFGAAVALVSCYFGFHSTGGAEGVGQAATKAFVFSFLAILFLDFWIGFAWNRLDQAIGYAQESWFL